MWPQSVDEDDRTTRRMAWRIRISDHLSAMVGEEITLENRKKGRFTIHTGHKGGRCAIYLHLDIDTGVLEISSLDMCADGWLFTENLSERLLDTANDLVVASAICAELPKLQYAYFFPKQEETDNDL